MSYSRKIARKASAKRATNFKRKNTFSDFDLVKNRFELFLAAGLFCKLFESARENLNIQHPNFDDMIEEIMNQEKYPQENDSFDELSQDWQKFFCDMAEEIRRICQDFPVDNMLKEIKAKYPSYVSLEYPKDIINSLKESTGETLYISSVIIVNIVHGISLMAEEYA